MPIRSIRARFRLESLVLPAETATARGFMDKGILRFMAEAYLLLHSGAMAQTELRAGSVAPASMKAERRQSRSRAAQSGESTGQQGPEERAKELIKD